jgi:GAF domain-containing protein
MDTDDRATVALRAERHDFDLEDIGGSLGSDGLILPMIVRGELLGATVVANRPGEHYPADERELLRHVVHEVGALLHALHARANAQLIAELAAGRLSPDAASERARALARVIPAIVRAS